MWFLSSIQHNLRLLLSNRIEKLHSILQRQYKARYLNQSLWPKKRTWEMATYLMKRHVNGRISIWILHNISRFGGWKIEVQFIVAPFCTVSTDEKRIDSHSFPPQKPPGKPNLCFGNNCSNGRTEMSWQFRKRFGAYILNHIGNLNDLKRIALEIEHEIARSFDSVEISYQILRHICDYNSWGSKSISLELHSKL